MSKPKIEQSDGSPEAGRAGHMFIIFLDRTSPVNVRNRIKDLPEICHIYCTTANPVQVIIAKSEQSRGMLGVIDGYSPKGIETEADIEDHKNLLRTVGYKL